MAIDQGTTGSTVLIVSHSERGARVVGRGYAEFPQYFPRPGWVEHDLGEIWHSVEQAMDAALKAARLDVQALRAIGITNQRETTALWHADGEPQGRAIVWQDRRTAEDCRALQEAGHAEMVRQRTGLVLDPYFSGTKLAWALKEREGAVDLARRGQLRFGTIDSWLVFKLTGAHVTDFTNAGRTLMFDIHRGQWDDDLLAVLGSIPRSVLPDVFPSSHVYGHTRGVGLLPDGIPVAGIAGDQHAALFGQACFQAGMAKCTYGTGAFALVNTGDKAVVSERGLLTTIAWRLGEATTYALEGSIFVAGAVVQWLRDQLGFFRDASEIEALARQVDSSEGVVLVPALTGLGAPHWRPEARGLLSGLTRGTTRAHIARAALEGIAFQVFDLLEAMDHDRGAPIDVLRVDGGASADNLLMQFQADLLGIEIHRPQVLDTTALGAAFLAALGIGLYEDLGAIASSWDLEATFTPEVGADVIQPRIEAWRAAVAKA